jgi:hypothetical protein
MAKAAILIQGQSNAAGITFTTGFGTNLQIVRYYDPGTPISVWQKGQFRGDGLRNAIVTQAPNLPVFFVPIIGETDAQNAVLAADYVNSFGLFISELEQDVNIVHSFILKINSNFTACPFLGDVAAGQLAVCNLLPSKRTLVDLDSIGPVDISLGLHYLGTGFEKIANIVSPIISQYL